MILTGAVAVAAVGCMNDESDLEPVVSIITVPSENTGINTDALSELVEPSETTEETTEATETVVSEPLSVLVSFAGDVTLTQNAGSSNFDNVVGDDTKYCFQNCVDIFSSDDMTLINLEGAVTERRGHVKKQFNFAMKPEALKMLTENSIESVNLANNHTRDYFQEGYDDTKQNLDNNGIYWSNQEKSVIYEVNGVKIGMFGITEYSGVEDGHARINELKKNGANIIIASVHWGVEATYTQTDKQVSIGHDLIDHGADIVVGTHPHRLQPIEKYNGKYILYSLSNFCFGGNSHLGDPDTAIIQCKFIMDETGTNCVNYELIVIPFTQTRVTGNDYCPTPYEWGTEDYFRVLNRLNWSAEDE